MNTFADPNDRYSYETWMNELAADDSKPARSRRTTSAELPRSALGSNDWLAGSPSKEKHHV